VSLFNFSVTISNGTHNIAPFLAKVNKNLFIFIEKMEEN